METATSLRLCPSVLTSPTSLCNGTPNNGIHNGLIPNGILCNYGSKTRMIFKRGIIWYPINGLFPLHFLSIGMAFHDKVIKE